MARRQYRLSNAISIQEIGGAVLSYDLVRIIHFEEWPADKQMAFRWELGRLNNGTWQSAGSSRHAGMHTYAGTNYDALVSLGQQEMMDSVYGDLGLGTGAKEDY